MTEKNTKTKSLLWASGLGALFAALCCFTPLAVVGLSAVGAGFAIMYLDIVFIPLLLLCVVIFAVGAMRLIAKRRASTDGG